MKYLLIIIISVSSFSVLSCDSSFSRIDLAKAKKKIQYQTEGYGIPFIMSASKSLEIKNKPKWILEQRPTVISGKSMLFVEWLKKYQNIFGLKTDSPKKFSLTIKELERIVTIEIELGVSDPEPNRELSVYEKTCGRSQFSKTTYY